MQKLSSLIESTYFRIIKTMFNTYGTGGRCMVCIWNTIWNFERSRSNWKTPETRNFDPNEKKTHTQTQYQFSSLESFSMHSVLPILLRHFWWLRMRKIENSLLHQLNSLSLTSPHSVYPFNLFMSLLFAFGWTCSVLLLLNNVRILFFASTHETNSAEKSNACIFETHQVYGYCDSIQSSISVFAHILTQISRLRISSFLKLFPPHLTMLFFLSKKEKSVEPKKTRREMENNFPF